MLVPSAKKPPLLKNTSSPKISNNQPQGPNPLFSLIIRNPPEWGADARPSFHELSAPRRIVLNRPFPRSLLFVIFLTQAQYILYSRV